MINDIEALDSAVAEAFLLGKFKIFCNRNATPESKNRLRRIFDKSNDIGQTIENIFRIELNTTLSEVQIKRMILLVKAHLNKKSYRRPISKEYRHFLLEQQFHRCKLCTNIIDESAHADHIVPFKYVGDELENNLQLLCGPCNEAKNENIDYQIRKFLDLI
ncbi:HNH endonuclease [Selenomonas ruminantium]|uniref:HNH endonuclease n=1 Tax=Selenomonas ruminantium TaxID=971 RepID=A0A1H0U6A2_SELRU|nr:HNH endonuclease [Selenomonas ruminantium]SDP61515.1 HNH endonuclease [Selenomonas ruminantium]